MSRPERWLSARAASRPSATGLSARRLTSEKPESLHGKEGAHQRACTASRARDANGAVADRQPDEGEKARLMARCPEDPTKLCGQPIGQCHCPFCGCMQVACLPHMCMDGCLSGDCDDCKGDD